MHIQNSKSDCEMQSERGAKATPAGRNPAKFAAATWLAEQHPNLKLFPLKPGTKLPAHKGWQAEATDAPAQLATWFNGKRDYNIGVACGPSGIVVVDSDVKPGRDGEANLMALAEGDPIREAQLDLTFTIATASGGRHRYFRTDKPIPNSVSKVAAAVDIRGIGGLVVAPGSRTEKGTYTVVNSAPIADLPDWLAEKIEAASASVEARKAPEGIESDAQAAIDRARAYLRTDAPVAVEGSGGDHTTYVVAARVRDMGISEATALDLIIEHYNPRCVPPWDHDDLAGKVANVFRYAQNEIGCDDPAADFDVLPDLDPANAPANDNGAAKAKHKKPEAITATPFKWTSPADLPPRQWLLAKHYIRKYATATVAPGKAGKTSFVLTEALSMATGRDLLNGGASLPEPLRVWYWNLEDPSEEMQRRTIAAMQHHGIDPAELDGRLFLDGDRINRMCVARKTKDGVEVVVPVVDALIAEIRARKIDVLIVDPFVKCHEVPENDNGAIDAVVKAWARVADLGNCSAQLIHHSRKLNGETMSADSARGAGSFKDACRGTRVIKKMTADEALALGLSDPIGLFSVEAEESSMARAAPAGKRDWYQLVSVILANGDDVQAVEKFTPADPLDDVRTDELEQVQKLFADHPGVYRVSDQSPEWAGFKVAEMLNLDIGAGISSKDNRNSDQNANRAKVKIILHKWKAAGAITVEARPDDKRRPRDFYAGPAPAPAAANSNRPDLAA